MLQLPTYSWTPSPNFSARGQSVRLIVAHDCEGSYAGSVSWFAQAQSQVSAHIVLSEDGERAVQMVAWANKAWHVKAFNGFSEGIEAAGYSAKGLGAPEWQALANLVAYRLRANGIPFQRATAQNAWTGYCQHVDLGAAGGGHHDISSDAATRAAFDLLILDAFGQDMPARWGGSQVVKTAPPVAPSGWKPSGTTRHDLPLGSIAWAQAALNAMRIPPMSLSVDDIEGPETTGYLEIFQRRVGLTPDGILGPATTQALQKALASA